MNAPVNFYPDKKELSYKISQELKRFADKYPFVKSFSLDLKVSCDDQGRTWLDITQSDLNITI